MLKFLITSIFLLSSTQVVFAKEVYDINIKIKCTKDKKKGADKEAFSEEVSIEIKKIDWNKDASKPPSWGSMSNIKIKSDGNLYEASLLLSTKQRVAFSYVGGFEMDGESASAQIYELDMAAMEMKRTSVSLFNQTNNKITAGVSYCKKL